MRGQHGLTTGFVVNVEDPEGRGRVQVLFPRISETLQSTWIPIATPMAGDKRGQFFMPEVGDEVVVGFDSGNFNHPIVLGFLWDGVELPPETEVKNRVIKTPGGHQLRFEDKDGQKKVIVKSDGGHQVEIDDSAKTVTVKTGSGSQSIVLDDSGQSIKLQGGGRIIEMSGGTVKIS